MTTEATPANATSENITKLPAVAPLPTPTPSATAEPAWVLKIDYALLGFLLLLSFFVASFTASNSDLWLHLAIGKRINEGKFEFGVDPYSWATEATAARPAVPWIHQSWLFSWLVYQIHESALGGAGLVVIKAILFTLAIGLLSRVGWNGPNRWFVLICLLLAVLAASGRLLLQPMVISLLFLAITIFLLDRAGAFALGKGDPQESLRSSWGLRPLRSSWGLWCLPPLFALWANLDAWFILGPLVVALCWAATWFGRWFPHTKMLPGKTLGLVVCVSVLACLMNPFHVRVFQLPPELAYLILAVTEPLRIPVPDALAAGGRTLRELRRLDPDLNWTLSIVSPRYWQDTRLGLNISGLAIAPLVLLGLLSFTLMALVKPQKEAPPFHVGRFLLWLVFAVMGLALYRLAPFFALVAAPLTAMTLGEFLHWQQTSAAVAVERRERGLKMARLVSVPFFVLLLCLAWPGWLHGTTDYYSPRRVAWQLRPDASFQRAAETLNELNKAGECKNVFNVSTELANYLPWFAPDVKYCLDSRFALYPQEVADFAKARDGVNKGPDADWQAIFREHDVDQIVMVNFLGRENSRLLRWWLDTGTWRQRYADKRVIVFSWAGPDRRWPADQMSADLNRQAFGEVPMDRRPPFTGTAPPTQQDAWASYLDGVPPQPAGVGAVEMLKDRFRLANQQAQIVRDTRPYSMTGLFAGLTSLQSAPSGGMGALGALAAAPPDLGPPALPILMVRTARQAVAENPLDPQAHLALEMANEFLGRLQEDYWIQARQGQHPSPLRNRLRQIQQVASLFNAVQLQPESFFHNEGLANLYLKQNLLDAALVHKQLAQKALEIIRAGKAGDEAKKVDVFIKQYRNEVDDIERNVKQRLSKWKEMSSKEKPFVKANLAYHGRFIMLLPGGAQRELPLGLGKTALDILETIDVDTLKDNETLPYTVLRFDLLLSMGRADAVRERLREERVKKGLPPALFARYQLLAAAGLGDYQSMDEALTSIEQVMRQEMPKSRDAAIEQAKACVPHFFEAGTETSAVGLRYTLTTRTLPTFMRFRDTYWSYEGLKGELCNNLTLHGIILLEAGETKKAHGFFQTALTEGEGALFFADRPIARRYRELLDGQQH